MTPGYFGRVFSPREVSNVAKQPHPQVAPPIGRGSSTARPAPQPSQRPANPNPLEEAARQSREQQHQEAPHSGTVNYGPNAVKMAFVFFGAEEFERISDAAEADGEKVGTWMANVLNDAARARIEFRDQDRDDVAMNGPTPPTE